MREAVASPSRPPGALLAERWHPGAPQVGRAAGRGRPRHRTGATPRSGVAARHAPAAPPGGIPAGLLPADWRATWLIPSAAGIGSGAVLGFVAERPLMAWRAGMLRRLGSSGRPAAAAPTPALGASR